LAFRLIRHSLLDPSLSRWGFRPPSRLAYCRSVEPLSDRPHRALHVPHEEGAVGVGAFFTPRSTVFIKAGVVHKLRSVCDQSSSSQPGYFDDLLLFRRVDKDSLYVHPSDLRLIRVSRPVRAPLGLLRRLRTGRYRFTARAGWRRDRTLSRVH
jgi:hypothetical protein